MTTAGGRHRADGDPIGEVTRMCIAVAVLLLLVLCLSSLPSGATTKRPVRVLSGGFWELTVLDALPAKTATLGCLAVGDVDGDGHQEVITGGWGSLLWYRPATFERGIIAEGRFSVGLALEDVDGDGRPEVVVAADKGIDWYKPGTSLSQPWISHAVDDSESGPHDLLFADIDGDGVRELVAGPTLRVYRRPADPAQPWRKHVIAPGVFAEGTSVGDLNGDGKAEIVFGPYLCFQPPGGPYSGPWERAVYAPGFREMCRTALLDVTGDGRPDIVAVESEFMEGRLAWFENRLSGDATDPWAEHELARDLVYGHSLQAWRDPDTREARFFIAEMSQGGYSAPRNWNARLMLFRTANSGRDWNRDLLDKGTGTHQAVMLDIDDDGEAEIVGKTWGEGAHDPVVQTWKRRDAPSSLTRFRSRVLDRDKPYTAIDIVAADVDGDGRQDVVCGSWWYHSPNWERCTIPGIHQVVNAYDLDGDGKLELVATKQQEGASAGYDGLTSELVWLKPVDPQQGRWEQYPIGTGSGDWPHGTAIAPLLPDGRLALVVGYHEAQQQSPELFEIPRDPRDHPWPKRALANIPYGEEMVVCDLTGNGRLDVVAGPWWLENLGDGRFEPHRICDQEIEIARIRALDVNADGRLDVLFAEESLDFEHGRAGYGLLGWFEQPADPRRPWTLHAIDKVRSPHSLDVADLDGDGELEVICGEHDPFWPYRSQSRLLVYKKAEPAARAWKRYLLDNRFEHHDGTKVIQLGGGRLGIMSHGWTDRIYVNLWEQF